MSIVGMFPSTGGRFIFFIFFFFFQISPGLLEKIFGNHGFKETQKLGFKLKQNKKW